MKHKNIWEAVVILVCVLGFGFAAAQKEGFHMDEMLSYEFSNAEFNPWIVPTQPQGRLAKFVEEEIRGSSAGETIGNVVNTVRVSWTTAETVSFSPTVRMSMRNRYLSAGNSLRTISRWRIVTVLTIFRCILT